MKADRGKFTTRTGFIFAAAGSAVGLGNIWGFPTNTASNGGAAFVLVYIVLAFCLAYPALMAELIIGRYARANIVQALQTVANTPATRLVGRMGGIYGVIISSFILSFYAIVAGWMISHLFEPFATMAGSDSTSAWLTTQSFGRDFLFCTLFSILTLAIIRAGVEKGIERWSCWLMPMLLVLLATLIIYVLFQNGAVEGLKVYLLPDFSRLTEPNLLVGAMGQAFFSLSLGVGAMLIYGSYIRSEDNLPAIGAVVTLMDTGIAFLAGMLIIPAMFVAQRHGVPIYSANGELLAGPDLIFQILPNLFEQMGPLGSWVATAFFSLMTIAALTSSISMLEVPVSYAMESLNISRHNASAIAGGAILCVSAIIISNFDVLFGRVVSFTTEFSQPLMGVLLCIFAGWILSRDKILQEIRQGYSQVESSLFWKVWPIYVRYFCPLLILLTFIQTLRN